MIDKIFNEDCLEGMKRIPSGSVDMILCDLPYGVTARNKWDVIIPFEPLWRQYKRAIKTDGAIVLTAQNLFSIELVCSNKEMYRYSIIWEKTRAVGFLNARRMPLRCHEDILVFYSKLPTYNPQFTSGKPYVIKEITDGDCKNYGKFSRVGRINKNNGYRFPRSVIKIANGNHNSLHPTQKPVELFEYLIKTYTNEGDVVLDNCIGSGTTAVACINTNRHFIGFETDKNYYDIALRRIEEARKAKESLLFK